MRGSHREEWGRGRAAIRLPAAQHAFQVPCHLCGAAGVCHLWQQYGAQVWQRRRQRPQQDVTCFASCDVPEEGPLHYQLPQKLQA